MRIYGFEVILVNNVESVGGGENRIYPTKQPTNQQKKWTSQLHHYDMEPFYLLTLSLPLFWGDKGGSPTRGESAPFGRISNFLPLHNRRSRKKKERQEPL